MKLNPATLLVLVMFGSFVVILGVMIAIFRPEPARVRPDATRTRFAQPIGIAKPDTAALESAEKSPGLSEKKPEATVKPTEKIKPVSPETSPTARASGQVYRQLEQEQKEMAQLRADLKKRLDTALSEQSEKLKQLARRCEPLEPGESVQILMPLSDEDLAAVLRYMQSSKALPIIALLKRNGREKALSKI
jgi:hypothetical protein